MPTDEQKRDDFVVYLKQLKLDWTIDREAEEAIILAILKHKGDKLDTYIAHFKAMVRKARYTDLSFCANNRSYQHMDTKKPDRLIQTARLFINSLTLTKSLRA